MADPRLASSQLHDDIDRLRAQVALSWSREVQALQRLGLRDGTSILEVGSGPGFVTERLLDSFPNSTLTAVDPDQRMSAVLRDRLSSHMGKRLEVIDASISMTPLPDASFDFALARYVFQHLPAPDLAASEMFRLLKPGGRVVIIDVDAAIGGIVAPALPAISSVFQKMHELQQKQGGNRNIGRQLWRILRAAGFSELDLQALVVHSDETGLDAFRPQYAPERIRRWVAPGGLTEGEWQSYRADFDRLMRTPDAQILELILLASGVRHA